MAGHNKWSQIKRKKGLQDAKKSKVFTKINKEITVAVKSFGGADPENNPRLRAALTWAKEENMPQDNVQRAIKKAAGQGEEDAYEEVIYEAYGPMNSAILIDSMTNNRNRTISNLRTIVNKNHARIANSNACLRLFQKVGILEVEKAGYDEEKLTEILLDLPFLDFETKDDHYSIVVAFSDIKLVSDGLQAQKVRVNRSEILMLPQEKVVVEDLAEAQKIIDLIDALEEDDDVQKVFGNFEFSESVLKALEEA